jgi:O-antigen ligase
MPKSIFSKLSLSEIFLAFIPIFSIFISITKGQSTESSDLYNLIFVTFNICFFILVILKNRAIRFPGFITYLLTLFIIWMGISTLQSQAIDKSIFELIKTTSFVLLFLGIFNLLRNNPHLQRITIVSLVLIFSLIIVKDFAFYLANEDFNNNQYFRGSLFWHNQMAGFLILIMPILGNISLGIKKFYLKIISFLLLAILFISFIFTFSRAGWLSLAIALIIFVFLVIKQIKKKPKLIFSLIFISLVMGAAAFAFTPVNEKVQSAYQELFNQSRTTSGSGRIEAWKNSVSMISDNPLLGTGPGSFGIIYSQYQTSPWLYAKNAHNHYLEYGAEIGIVGMVIFLSFAGTICCLIFKNRKYLTDHNKHPLLLGVSISFAAALIHASLDIDWSRMPLFAIFWISAGIIASSLVKKDKKINIYGIKRFLYLPFIFILIMSFVMLLGQIKFTHANESLNNNTLEDANENIELAIRLNPWNTDYRFLHALILSNLQQTEKSSLILENIIQQSPSNIEAYFNLGLNAYLQNDFKNAYRNFDNALNIGQYYSPKIYNYLSRTMEKMNKEEKRQRLLEKEITEIFPLGKVYDDLEYLYEFSGLKKELADSYLQLADIYISNDQKEKARKLVDKVSKELDPENEFIPVFQNALNKLP